MLTAVLVSFVCHLPYYFQFKIEESQFCTDPEDDVDNLSLREDFTCWIHVNRFIESDVYLIYSFAYQVIIIL